MRCHMEQAKSRHEAFMPANSLPQTAFRCLNLFRQKGESMNVVSAFLSSQVTKILHKDESLMSQLEDLEIASQVKEPYSLWKKLLQK